ncbi:Uncharacterised protein [Legionella beliardensis]|uniref:AttH domain-containing protein n=1 Tax=Legionella beliardensis TaxID=91822 RepID=A0A378I316_9GAMM|nr:hypothetical protein [Legionella beliardensis]STX29569.1 Uncharacterised protein [Legionella beliardensis]
MKQIRACILLLVLYLMLSGRLLAAQAIEPVANDEPLALQTIPSLHVPQADWAFAGTVTNESGERYIYFFEIQRNYDRFHGLATVIDAQSKTVLVYEESNTLIKNPELTHWQVGNLFLRFNPINSSWVFGVKDKKKTGFNFKVDMLGLAQTASKQKELRSGVEFLIDQTGRLNGHIQAGESKELFVTAKKAWFRQIWVNKPQPIPHSLKSVLCNFNDGSALYSVSLQESDTIRGSIAGWRNEQGTPVTMSQFITTQQEKENLWHIHVPSPKVNLSFENLLYKINESQQLIIGITAGAMPGFCAINYEDIDDYAIEQAGQTKEKGNG